jgi:SHS2 domain-containing protein
MEEAPRLTIESRPAPWTSRGKTGSWRELEHPADLLLQITGSTLSELFENALGAFYAQVADLDQLGSEYDQSTPRTLELATPSLSEALRALLAEALYLFDCESFVATAARVDVHEDVAATDGNAPGGGLEESEENRVRVSARLWGEKITSRPEVFLAEVKAVTYHQLAVTQQPDGRWQATVLFDV